MKKVAFHNLGCKVNSYETEAMLKQFVSHGYEVVSFDQIADVYIVNTCTVTSVADKKSRQMLHRAKKLNKDALVVAVGCYVQADGERALADEAVDIVIGNESKSRVYELVEAHENFCTDISQVKTYDEMGAFTPTIHSRAFIKIQDGCNQFCSYCLIPYVRGRIRSRNSESVIEEVTRLAGLGIKEFVLGGIHLSSYGAEGAEYGGNWLNAKGEPLLDLLTKLDVIVGDGRIRLGSLEPRIMTRDFVEKLSKIKSVCPHFHLSLQSGCDETLKRMNRHYTASEYKASCEIIREFYEHPAITTDVIVGFPGETDEEFEKTVSFLEDINLYEMHIFKYSIRKGTNAEKLPDRVPPEIAEKRSNILLEMTARHKAEFENYYKGKTVKVLVEEILEDGYFTGYTAEYVKVTKKISDLPSQDVSTNEFVEVVY